MLAYAALSAVLLSLPWTGVAPGWVLFFAFLPLLVLEEELSKKRNSNRYAFFNYAFLSFWLWHVFTVWWVIQVSTSGIILLSVANSMIMALIWWIFHRMKITFKKHLAKIGLVSLWLAFEFLHHRWEIEWPWLCLGNGLAGQHKIIQWYSYTGILGGSLWLLIANLVFYSTFKKIKSRNYIQAISRFAMAFTLIAAPVFASSIIYNNYKETGEEIEIAILQPNIDPFTEKFSALSPEQQLQILLHLADSVTESTTSYVVGPETCLPEINEDSNSCTNPFIQPFLERSQQSPNLKFVFGAITRQNYSDKKPQSVSARYDELANIWYDLFNTALQIDHKTPIQYYHKSKLVAGVEKMPFQRFFKSLESLSLNLGGTSGSLGKQEEPSLLTSDHALAPIVCFESLFGQYITGFVKKGANFLVIITNDGWLPNSSGYRQHLDIAKIRAIESRRSIARSANTGISAFINQRGDILNQTRWGERTAISGTIRSNTGITFYTKYGDYIGRIALFTGTLLLLYYSTRTYMRK